MKESACDFSLFHPPLTTIPSSRTFCVFVPSRGHGRDKEDGIKRRKKRRTRFIRGGASREHEESDGKMLLQRRGATRMVAGTSQKKNEDLWPR